MIEGNCKFRVINTKSDPDTILKTYWFDIVCKGLKDGYCPWDNLRRFGNIEGGLVETKQVCPCSQMLELISD
jgi:hypothetical protein